MGAGTKVADVQPQQPDMDFKSRLMIITGFAFLAIALPFVAVVVGSAVGWYYVDPVTPWLFKKVGRQLEPYWVEMVRKKEDAFMVNLVILQAAKSGEISLFWAYAYHILRIGPYFMNFAYAYTLCHKEGHSMVGLFSAPYAGALKNIFNWWIGLFYGVMPSNFAYGHTRNHHRHNNTEEDVITTWDRPRDSFINYVRYIPRFLGYALNITAIRQFYREKEYGYITGLLGGSLFYGCFFGAVAYLNTSFAIVYLGYPMIEATLLLSAINWSWHCFLDPDMDNHYSSSITILGGDDKTNILNEDYHVVHHQYPGAHWSTHPAMFEKHRAEYAANKATIFNNTHAIEIFFFAILQKYDLFAERFEDLGGTMTYDDKLALVKLRLQTCEWGPMSAKGKAKVH